MKRMIAGLIGSVAFTAACGGPMAPTEGTVSSTVANLPPPLNVAACPGQEKTLTTWCGQYFTAVAGAGFLHLIDGARDRSTAFATASKFASEGITFRQYPVDESFFENGNVIVMKVESDNFVDQAPEAISYHHISLRPFSINRAAAGAFTVDGFKAKLS